MDSAPMPSSPPAQNIPAELTGAPRWVLHSNKIPRMPNGANASVTDPRTWISFQQATRHLDRGSFDGIGYVLGEGVVGVDLDSCIDDLGGLNELARKCIERCAPGTYVEVSLSGRGLHIIGRSKALARSIGRTTLLDGKLEVYTGKRFFAITGQLVNDTERFRPTPQLQDISALLSWLQEQTQDKVREIPVQAKEAPPSLRELQQQLEFIDPSDDGTWLKVGMAIKDAYGEQGWALFDEWSARTTANNYEPVENRRRWDSFGQKGDGERVGIATVRMLARQGGWNPADGLEILPLPEGPASLPRAPQAPSFQPAAGVDIARAFASQPAPRKWLLQGYLERGKTGVVAATGGGSKTQFLLQLAMAVALGEPLAGLPTTGVKDAGSSLLLVTEDDQEEVSRRLWGIHQLRRYSEEEVRKLAQRVRIIPLVGMPVQLMQLNDGNPVPLDQRIEEIITQARALPDVRLVVLDPLARFLAGEEGSNQMGVKFVEIMERIARETGAAAIVSAHINKAAIAKLEEGAELSQADVRGASAIVFNTRATVFLTPPAAPKNRERWCGQQGIDEREFDDIVKMRLAKTNVSKTGNEWYLRRVVLGESSVLERFEFNRPIIVKRGKHAKMEIDPKTSVYNVVADICSLQPYASLNEITMVVEQRYSQRLRWGRLRDVCRDLVEDRLLDEVEEDGKKVGWKPTDTEI